MTHEELCSITDLPITADEFTLLSQYVSRLLEWNKKINLISRKNETDVFTSHIVPSLLFSKVADFKNKSVVDVGTGGGLPGIPLAICFQDSKFILNDSIQKKITAVQDIATNLNLKNVSPLCGRAENIFKNKKFNFVVARGVTKIKSLVEYSLPLTKDKIFLITLKGGDLKTEKEEALKSFSYIKIEELPIANIVKNNLWDDKKFIVVSR